MKTSHGKFKIEILKFLCKCEGVYVIVLGRVVRGPSSETKQLASFCVAVQMINKKGRQVSKIFKNIRYSILYMDQTIYNFVIITKKLYAK